MTNCKHLFVDVCGLARNLLQKYGIDACPKPHRTACEFCTRKARPSRAVNEVIVNLALAETRHNPDVRNRILTDHVHLLRQPPAKKKASDRLQAIEQGTAPGSQLWRLLAELGIQHKPTCTCLHLAETMNQWGPAGCRLARPEIIAQMRTNAKEYGWLDVARAAAKAVSTGIAWKLDLTDVYGSLLDEAIRRSGPQAPTAGPDATQQDLRSAPASHRGPQAPTVGQN
jgi:hypothetical protein